MEVNIKLSELLGAVGCKAPTKDVFITDVTADSRKAGKGALFVSIKGSIRDGNDFIHEAIGNGAGAVVTENKADLGDDIPCIVVDDTRKMHSMLCAAFYCGVKGTVSPSIIAVTGTNGKTTTAHMIAHILSSAGYKTGIVGTVGSGFYSGSHATAGGMTTPDPESFYRELGNMREAGADYIVIEASSHGIAQHRLAGIPYTGCVPRAAVFTNLSPEHMDFHPTLEDYFDVKARLFTDFGFSVCVINTDDEYGRRLYGMCDGAVSVGERQNADCRVGGISSLGEAGVEYTLSLDEKKIHLMCPMAGTYTVYNSMLAVAVAVSLGVDPMAVSDAIASFGGVRGRMERVAVDESKFSPPVYIDFAHTPAALEALLLSIRSVFPTKRLVLLFGCGGDRDKTKRAVMGRIASRLADYTIITADNSRTEKTEAIIADIMNGILPTSAYSVIKDREKAIEYAIMNADDNDVIILAGKGHEDYDDRDGVKRSFDERRIVFLSIDKRYRTRNIK